MSDLSSDNPVIALAVADLHITSEPPISRSGEPSWEAVIQRQFRDLRSLQKQHDNVPILCAGDVFQKWNSDAETINLALTYLPQMIAIPGQHDLPYHALNELKKTAFGVLEKAGKIVYVEGSLEVQGPGGSFSVHGFPWGVSVAPLPAEKKKKGHLHIALIHAYCWNGNAKHLGASEQSEVKNFDLKGYDVAVFGDNHKSFDSTQQRCIVFNCGGFFRRNSDEVVHRPRVGLIHRDGSVESHFLDITQDVFLSKTGKDYPKAEEFLSVAEFVEELTTMKKGSINFIESLEVYQKTHKLSPMASQLLHQLINES